MTWCGAASCGLRASHLCCRGCRPSPPADGRCHWPAGLGTHRQRGGVQALGWGFSPARSTAAEALDLKGLVTAVNATVAIHAFDSSDFFYFDHAAGTLGNAELAGELHRRAGVAGRDHQIQPLEIPGPALIMRVGSNALDWLHAMGIEFRGTMMDPGGVGECCRLDDRWAIPNVEWGRLYRDHNVYYAAPLPTDSRFFNCVTEFRDADPPPLRSNPTPAPTSPTASPMAPNG